MIEQATALDIGSLASTADLYPHQLDLVRKAVLLIRMTAAGYRSASFLDERILNAATKGTWISLAEIHKRLKSPAAGPPVHFIFHIGHVGSTLVSRLLDEHGHVLSLREPLPLRTMAQAHDLLHQMESLLSAPEFDQTLDEILALWGRGFPGTEAVVVKATSHTGRLATTILARRTESRAIYLTMKSEQHVTALLSGQNSPIDLRGFAQERIRRLQRLAQMPFPALHTMSLGELAAMSWLTETLTVRQAQSAMGGRLLVLDFDDVLRDIASSAQKILMHLALTADSATLKRIVGSETLSCYSKAPEHPYSAQLRAQILTESRAEHAGEILRAMHWLQQAAERSPAVAAVLE